MVVFVDYDHDVFPGAHDGTYQAYLQPDKPALSKLKAIGSDPPTLAGNDHSAGSMHDHTKNDGSHEIPNRNGFSAALSCYPIVKEIARQVDLNTLYALSRTCRQFHANLTPYRHQLVKQTLRCENEYVETLSDLLDGRAAIPDSVRSVLRLVSQGTLTAGRLVRGKNCTIKTPPRNTLKDRVRRLCTTCRAARPFEFHSISFYTFTISDTTYRRVWTWRTRYSTYLGGLGTGIGEGCQGVKCGREENCLAAQEIELEVECEADESSASGSPHNHHQGNAHAHGHLSPQDELLRDQSLERSNSRDEEKPGYFRQEIIGIGGRVKQKAKKRVTVGACVVEYEDERDTGQYLTREEQGLNRSWCSWCCRVIPSKDDLAYPLSIH
ncbi:hypothetical protein CNMCM6936_000019 [Aspergillus lentulus]|uniref:F-box domain-containing protein n=1 Tax=Aspergillus lentulus TaxID=293939 RepID=A0AAN6BQG0_ASPLE|nr:hypothetical protein CNMCM6936_000019 [Aspergillus lentulus]KAF4171936.1 hypothetical protein CNMCM8060_002131 [Aspergillus lentulus]KAF4181384.1 hypothetical protein CNMCM7927_000692 [Aspergillus lentulus]KAF4192483.1 hypothetical protein CNMCM8694_000287 [Aspergillus lentulus]KAF4204795.1 hypothetical protein CNMCM8927_007064 [Aspergillus lentulus]